MQEIYAMTKYSNKDALGFIRYLPSACLMNCPEKTVCSYSNQKGLTALIAEYYKGRIFIK